MNSTSKSIFMQEVKSVICTNAESLLDVIKLCNCMLLKMSNFKTTIVNKYSKPITMKGCLMTSRSVPQRHFPISVLQGNLTLPLSLTKPCSGRLYAKRNVSLGTHYKFEVISMVEQT